MQHIGEKLPGTGLPGRVEQLRRGAAFQDAVRVEDLHAGLDMRPFQPAIRFISYLLLADHRPAGALTLAFAAEIRATLREAVRQRQ
ncbi:hypothetical protein [Pseudomonas oryzihabitans]|uniref:hypothetical protein n=1 Tax=Pseudomonas oryzihabitans TaxID=47885 RepID=UPI00286561EF|nr:hypothetical protein [Pseudomonas psychrotolerans]MDR6679919.1 hypothetical protein [Pseudomonas psychrotolerans]